MKQVRLFLLVSFILLMMAIGNLFGSQTSLANSALLTTPARATSQLTPTPTSTQPAFQNPTATPTDLPVAPQPTPTPTDLPVAPAPTPTPFLNLIAQHLEVTQAIQDLNNSVRLVQGKRTFVRFHLRAILYATETTAHLRVQRGNEQTTLLPINDGGPILPVPRVPDRAILNEAFLFELPDGFREGEVTLTGIVNPSKTQPLEKNYNDNESTTTVTFEETNSHHIHISKVRYRDGNTYYDVDHSHRLQLVDWLQRAFPISEEKLNITFRSDKFTRDVNRDNNGVMKNLKCWEVNLRLWNKWNWNVTHDHTPHRARFYGMVSDEYAFMRGCANNSPGNTASGPTGSNRWDWDTDGSYGDWYGGHELGHAYGRPHAPHCHTKNAEPYPYPEGYISPPLEEGREKQLYGFDISTRAIYAPTWKDVMTYCEKQWVSDFTYEALLNKFQEGLVGTASQPNREQVQQARLLIMGAIDPDTGEAHVEPIFVLPDAPELHLRRPGDHTIVLRGDEGVLLARYPFSLRASHAEENHSEHEVDEHEIDDHEALSASPVPYAEENVLYIAESIPYTAGITQIDILGPDGQPLHSVRSGAGVPSVTIISPNGGEQLDTNSAGRENDPIEVRWRAEDPDGDPLTFHVEYSADGRRWELVAQGLTENVALIDAENVTAGSTARFRVWASDGIHTASDPSGADFTVVNRPPHVAIRAPETGATFVMSQTIPFDAVTYDLDSGLLGGAQIRWHSDRDGEIGRGRNASIAGLSVGQHVITVEARDEQGSTASEQVLVTVVASAAELPKPDATRHSLFLPLIMR